MRILAVTDDAHLSVALGLSSRTDLDVTTVGSFDGLAEATGEGFDAVLVAYRDTELAIDAAGAVQRLSDLPCVVVAPRIDGALPDGVVGLSPPTDVSAVEQALHRVVEQTGPEPPPTEHVEGPPEERHAAEPIAPTSIPDIGPAAPATGPTEPSPVERPEISGPIGVTDGGTDVEAPSPAEPVVDDPAPTEVTAKEPERAPEPAEAEPDEKPSLRSRAARLLRRGSDPKREKRRRAFPARERIDAGLRAAEDLQALIDELPELNERRALASRLVSDVAETIGGAEAVVLWGPDGEGGLEALAHHGVPLGVVQRGASTAIPLFSDLLGDRDRVAYRAEERFSDYLEGLPGLRGSCVLGAALRAHDDVHGLLVISGDHVTDSDLRELEPVIELHTVTLAVAAHIELLRVRRSIDLTNEDGEWLVRGD